MEKNITKDLITVLLEKRRKCNSELMYGYYTGQVDMMYDIRSMIKKKEISISNSELEDYILVL